MTYEAIMEERGYHPPTLMLSIANKDGRLQHILMPEMEATQIDMDYQKPFDEMDDYEKADYIIKRSMLHYGIKPNNATRKREQVTYRFVSMYIIHLYTELSLSIIGGYFGKDHATVLHAFKTVRNLMETDRRYRENVENIINEIEL